MTLPQLAQSVLNVASTALPDVDRTFLAAGPIFAKTCRLLAVYANPITVESLAVGLPSDRVTGSCGVMVVPQVVLVYAKDCYPMPTGQSQVQLPPDADLTAWTTDYLTDVETLMGALLDAAEDGTIGDDCASVTIGATIPTGPTAGVATTSFPVQVRPLA